MLADQPIDYVGLGCTHYPFLLPQLQKITHGRYHFIDVGIPVAQRVKHLVNSLVDPAPPKHHFLTTASPQKIQKALKLLLNIDTKVVKVNL